MQHDKILILEDTDGDGKADKQTIFARGLHLRRRGRLLCLKLELRRLEVLLRRGRVVLALRVCEEELALQRLQDGLMIDSMGSGDFELFDSQQGSEHSRQDENYQEAEGTRNCQGDNLALPRGCDEAFCLGRKPCEKTNFA